MSKKSMLQTDEKERALIVSVERDEELLPYAREELIALLETAGAEVVGEFHQRRNKPDVAYYIGTGKTSELYAGVQDTAANLVVVDSELNPVQARNLEEAVKCRVIDRTQLILDIFAQRAQTREGKLQVSLAQLTYLLPRLSNLYTRFERQQGGIGVRGGQGETKLETDRRKVRDTIRDLEAQIAEVRSIRQTQRVYRKRLPFPTIALVGYTSAGKSSILNRLSGSEALVDPRLFATLDPTTRRVSLPDGWAVLLTDTVGFIRNLPTHLVAAFRATLEETVEADILLHVADASHPHCLLQMQAVHEVLDQLDAGEKPMITVFNKCDLVSDRYALQEKIADTENSVAISALTGEGVPELMRHISAALQGLLVQVNVLLPYQRTDLLAQCHEYGRVEKVEYGEYGIEVTACVTRYLAGHLQNFASPEIMPERETALAENLTSP